MKTYGITTAAAAVAMLCPTVMAVPASLKPRGRSSIAKSILELIGGFLEPDMEWLWDIKQNPQMCKIYMETTDGANCYASVTCDDGTREYNAGKAGWNVCYVGGRQFFSDPRIGEFSITFTQKDGESAEGLTNPVLQLKNVGNWKEIDVYGLAHEYYEHQFCEGRDGRDCGDGPWICHHL
jgi:hypothetical protein